MRIAVVHSFYTAKQAEYLGIPAEGPFKPEYYRY